MTDLLPLASYGGSGSGASVDLGVFRALRGTVDVSGFSGVSPVTVALETSSDGASWRNVGTWQSITEEGQLERVFAGLPSTSGQPYACGASTAEISIKRSSSRSTRRSRTLHRQDFPNGRPRGVSNEEILSALEGASRPIDDYLAARTTLPLVVFAERLTASSNGDRGGLRPSFRHRVQPEGDNDNFRQRYLDIIKWRGRSVRRAPLPAGIEDSTNTSEGVAEVRSDDARAGDADHWRFREARKSADGTRRARSTCHRTGRRREHRAGVRDRGPVWLPQGRRPVRQPWAPLAKKRKRHGKKKRGDKILRDTGRLANSISASNDGNSAKVGTNVEYAAYHQYGTGGHKASMRVQTVGKNGRFKSKNSFGKRKGGVIGIKLLEFKEGGGKIPARPFLPMDSLPASTPPRRRASSSWS